jgi:hypothetical protein
VHLTTMSSRGFVALTLLILSLSGCASHSGSSNDADGLAITDACADVYELDWGNVSAREFDAFALDYSSQRNRATNLGDDAGAVVVKVSEIVIEMDSDYDDLTQGIEGLDRGSDPNYAANVTALAEEYAGAFEISRRELNATCAPFFE